MAQDDSFPPTLDQTPQDTRLTETFGILPATTAIVCLIGAIGFFFDPTTPIVNLLPQVIGLFVAAALLLGWEFVRRSNRTTLVVAGDRIGIYRDQVFAQVASKNQVTEIQLNTLRTMQLVLPSSAIALLGLGIGFMNSSWIFLVMGFIGTAVLGSGIYSRTMCRHYEVPKGTGIETVAFPAKIVSRLDGVTLHEVPAQGSSIPTEFRNILFGGAFLVLVPAIGGLVYYFQSQKRDKSADERAHAWVINYRIVDELLAVEVQNAPAGSQIKALGKEQACDDHCRITFSRRELKPGQLKIEVTLLWNGHSIRKSIEREAWKPLVTFDNTGTPESKEKLTCELSTNTNGRPKPIQVKFDEQGLTLHAKGADGDNIVIGRRPRDEPGAGKDYVIANKDLLEMLTLKPLLFPFQNVDITLPISMESIDGTKEKAQIVCGGDVLRGYLSAEFKASRLSTYASNAPKTGAFVMGDALFFVGESSSPWDAPIVATVERREVSSQSCTYGDGYVVSYHWYDHTFHAYELRTSKDLGTKRFSSTKPGSWTCPGSAGTRTGGKSRSEDMPPNGDELARWFTSLVAH